MARLRRELEDFRQLSPQLEAARRDAADARRALQQTQSRSAQLERSLEKAVAAAANTEVGGGALQ